MIDNRIISYIKHYLSRNLDKNKLAKHLIKQGYKQKDVWDTINFLSKKPKKHSKPLGMKEKVILAVLFSVLVIAAIILFVTRPVCNNGFIERGETMETCCEDVGCLGDQPCVNHQCAEPTCKDCQYLSDHKCISYGCCKNEDCPGDKECKGNACVALACGKCQYAYDNKCNSLKCCEDTDCDDKNPDTHDTCKNPWTLDASCSSALLCSSDKECDDHNSSTRDTCYGEPKECFNIPIVKCGDNDGYCPSDCTYATDNDCAECSLGLNVSYINISDGSKSNVLIAGSWGSAGSITWVIQNTTVATISPSTGNLTTISAKKVGSTKLITTDTAVGSYCNISTKVDVY